MQTALSRKSRLKNCTEFISCLMTVHECIIPAEFIVLTFNFISTQLKVRNNKSNNRKKYDSARFSFLIVYHIFMVNHVESLLQSVTEDAHCSCCKMLDYVRGLRVLLLFLDLLKPASSHS